MNRTINIIRHTARAATVLLLALLTAQTAWADTETVSYIDADGNAQTATATVLTGNEEPSQWGSIDLSAGWYVVKGNISYTNQINYSNPTGTIHIILADGAQMSVEYNGYDAISLNSYHPLAIYGQSAGTGRLSVTSDHIAISALGGITINGGIVSATSTGNGRPAISANNGAITINGGQVTATPGDNAKGITTEGTITLGLRSTSDFITANGYYGTVNIKDGQTLYDQSGNGYTGNGVSIPDNATLRSWSPDDFSVNGAGTEYTIHTATGWNVFCDLLESGESFSGKTVRLGDDITVTRMAGGQPFTGTFDGGGYTLTVSISNSNGNAAPFCEIKGATIRNLKVSGTVSGHKHSAGLVSYARGADSSVENTIENCLVATDVSTIVDTDGDCYLGGIVGHGFNCKLTIRGCAFTGSLTSPHNYTGGLQGWSDGNTLILENDIFATSSVNAANVGFHPIAIHANNASTTATVSNVYYTIAPTCTTSTRIAAAGKQAHTVAAGENVTLALSGTATEYGVSDITVYEGNHGIKFGTTYYAGTDDQLAFTLTTSAVCPQPGYQYGYTASAGTFSGTTLTMPDEDVTISVNTAALAPIDWETVNQGTIDDPYMIYNKDQLLLLAHRVNGTNGETANDYGGKYFKLGADITFDHPVAEPDDYAENYEAIGCYFGGTMRLFNGRFNGDGHTVSGIRIRKTSSGNAYNFQGLFGCIGGAEIHDVHLTDARITGYQYVGGIAGFNGAGYIMRCTVTDSYITATGNLAYGTICGYNDSGTLRNNYYHDCTVNGTPVTSGMGCKGADITAYNGALPAYRLDLGANITTPPGTFAGQTEWLDTPPVNPRLAPENGFTLAGNHYFASGYVFTPGSTLASGAAQGYTPRATLGGQLLDLYTPTDNAPDYTGTAIARLTITADCDRKTLNAAIRSDGQQHEVSYMTADGSTQTAQAVALDGHETNLAAGWYFVGKNISYDATLTLDGDVNLILVDGKTMKVRTTKTRDGISAEGHSLHIYGQTEGTGILNAQTNGKLAVVIRITNGTLGIHGGNVNANDESTVNTKSAIRVERATAGDALVIDRGTLTANSKGCCGIYIYGGDARINGGQVTATGEQLGIDISDYVDEDDESLSIPGILTLSGGTLTASSFDTWSGESFAGTLAIAPGLTYTDGTSLYDSTTETATLAALGGKTLQPCLALADAADNTAAIDDHAGKTLAVALSGRTLYKDGSWNTLCLPFSVDLTASGPLSGDNVQAMTLNTTTSTFADGTLTLNFTAATTIPAGTPFIIKWDRPSDYEAYDGQNAATCSDLVSPVFQGVTIDAENRDATVTDVLTFTGTYTPVTTPATGDNTKLYLGADNKLFYPTKTMTIGTHRAYFQLLGDLTAGEPTSPQPSHVRAFNLNFGDDEATGIISVHDSGFTVNGSDVWYTLDGRRLDAQPTAKGLYIHGGKKVAIK